MRQFYEAYRNQEKVSPLVRQSPWTHNLNILGQTKLPEERGFYLQFAVQEKWSKRELERQIKSALFERAVLAPAKVSPSVRQKYPEALSVFKDAYMLEFLDLPPAMRISPFIWNPWIVTSGKLMSVRLSVCCCVPARTTRLWNMRSAVPCSPVLIAEYQTHLPDRKLLQTKLHEFYLQNAND